MELETRRERRGRCASASWSVGARAAAAMLLAAPAGAAEPPYAVTEERAPCARREPLRRPFFGDTHVHTTYSLDANTQGTRNTPADAYRFAKGEPVGLQPYDRDGKPLRTVKLRRPLDFTAVTDHAEALGEVRICRSQDLQGADSDICWSYRAVGPAAVPFMLTRLLIARERFDFCGENGELCRKQAGVVWRDIQRAAEEAYDRSPACAFTSFVGYEWTGSLGDGVNLHRNVIFRNEKVPDAPVSWVDVPSAAKLWEALERECIEGKPGCDALTIPHNSNLSGPGLMFESAKLTSAADAKQPVTAEEARARQRWEPLVEIMQHKGDSECLLGLDTTDEECAFEKLPYDSFSGVPRFAATGVVGPRDRATMVREALKKGLRLEEELGVNPLKYGIIASTDTHLGTPGLTDEDRAAGHGGAGISPDPKAPPKLPDNAEFNPGGLAVLWAEENTRDALFAAMQRREAYGTSGTRPVVRFFGGWEYAEALCDAKEFAARGYAQGVPMGSDLPPRPPRAGAPTFAVSALQDPGTKDAPGTPLQRVQIVKGWVEKGAAREKVYDVAGGENGASVDTRTCEASGRGATNLCSVWRDPDFEPQQRAFYYVRVLENPTCRWSQRLCVEAKVDCEKPETFLNGFAGCCLPSHEPTVQERAWTSPIWYAPAH
jgi:hypothetical protein